MMAGNGAITLTQRLEEAKQDLEAAISLATAFDETPSSEVRTLLSDLYGRIWTEAIYDPDCDETQRFAARLLPLIIRLNELLKFKR